MKSNFNYDPAQPGQTASAAALPVFPNASLALTIDLYLLTMAQGYLLSGMESRSSVFHMFYRHAPFRGRYAVVAGMSPFADWLEALAFTDEDIEFLSTVPGKDGRPLFVASFLRYLKEWRFRGSIEAVPEGTILFPHEPMVRVRAPLFDAQLLEAALLAIVNHQTLIATKASRVRLAAGSDEVLEFGLRRAQGLDGGLSSSRAAYIGGIDATSNVLAAARFGIPVRGTHAHSWVMAFDEESEAFTAYADLFPHNSVLLVDTYDSLEGVKKAVEVGLRLRSRGADLMGIRLDSGDLAYLATEARRYLDAHGFQATRIVASNELDERIITSLKSQGAPIDIWGVGTKLITAFDEPALGGVYKLAAVANGKGDMVARMKISDQSAKTSIPGCLDVARLSRGAHCVGDVIFDTQTELPPGQGEKIITIISPEDPWKRKAISAKAIEVNRLLVPLFEKGKRVSGRENITAMRRRTLAGLASFDKAILRFENPHAYAAGLSQALFEQRQLMREHEFEKIKHRLAAVPENGHDNGFLKP
ncbi:nicotinate phosphoribosyltransferase [Desulfopila sp. IMCC35006]|uniref:nicotinate phosphoribosyltransferase n=1 Tax=Desulfopila sp. IMCC35006 TaxID=2569542 RepID=UPI0010AC4409|nr:nicotinate phosphoribosyltransferase [Desulfopila sp. IMCC35006]TKB25495.1 nicotinate phosphoribosyltransferase [Desulfopila sp. IMCC35006]